MAGPTFSSMQSNGSSYRKLIVRRKHFYTLAAPAIEPVPTYWPSVAMGPPWGCESPYTPVIIGKVNDLRHFPDCFIIFTQKS